jgi:hypothetical protein
MRLLTTGLTTIRSVTKVTTETVTTLETRGPIAARPVYRPEVVNLVKDPRTGTYFTPSRPLPLSEEPKRFPSPGLLTRGVDSNGKKFMRYVSSTGEPVPEYIRLRDRPDAGIDQK